MKVHTEEIEDETFHRIEGVTLTGAIWDDLERICEDEEIESFLWGELGSDEILTDGTHDYCGADIQDWLDSVC